MCVATRTPALGFAPPLICDFVTLSDSDMVQRHFDITSHIYGCHECPDGVDGVCQQAASNGDQVYAQNVQAITPTCPQWPWSKP